MRLAAPASVIRTMGIMENQGSLTNAEYALDLSFPILENLLESTFESKHVTDFFDTIRGELCLRTTNRFLDPDSIKVRYSTNGDPLIATMDGELMDSSEYSVNTDLGTITLRKEPPLGMSMVSVEYDSGLQTSDDDDNVLDAPQWLSECSVAVAVHVLNTFPSSPANRKDKNVVNVSAEIRHLASQLINSRKRPRMTVTFPAVTLVDE